MFVRDAPTLKNLRRTLCWQHWSAQGGEDIQGTRTLHGGSRTFVHRNGHWVMEHSGRPCSHSCLSHHVSKEVRVWHFTCSNNMKCCGIGNRVIKCSRSTVTMHCPYPLYYFFFLRKAGSGISRCFFPTAISSTPLTWLREPGMKNPLNWLIVLHGTYCT